MKPRVQTGPKGKRAKSQKKTMGPLFEFDPQPRRSETGTAENLFKKHYIPPLAMITMSKEGITHDCEACYVEYAGEDFGKRFADFTINQFGVQVASITSREELKVFCGTIVSAAAAIMIKEVPLESQDGPVAYWVFQVWCQRIWNVHTKARIETIWLGGLPTLPQRFVEPACGPSLGTNWLPAETGVVYPWSQSIEGIEIAQHVTGSSENVIDQIIRLSQGMRILSRLQKVGRPIGERAERGITKKEVLRKYGELVQRFGEEEGIRLPHLLRALGMSAPTFSRYGFRFRDIQKEHREYREYVNRQNEK